VAYYVRGETSRLEGCAEGSPQQALRYIATNLCDLSLSNSSDSKAAYVARMDDGWRRNPKSVRLSLTGHGTLAGVRHQAARSENSCPWHSVGGSVGYKGLT
jgi:hypothetical protein